MKKQHVNITDKVKYTKLTVQVQEKCVKSVGVIFHRAVFPNPEDAPYINNFENISHKEQ